MPTFYMPPNSSYIFVFTCYFHVPSPFSYVKMCMALIVGLLPRGPPDDTIIFLLPVPLPGLPGGFHRSWWHHLHSFRFILLKRLPWQLPPTFLPSVTPYLHPLLLQEVSAPIKFIPNPLSLWNHFPALVSLLTKGSNYQSNVCLYFPSFFSFCYSLGGRLEHMQICRLSWMLI